MYTINTVTGAATQMNSISALNGAAYGVDFNPVPPARAWNAPHQTRAES